MMESIVGGMGFLGILFYFFLILLWVLVPVFIFLISSRVKDMRDMARASRLELKEVNANLKYLKRKFNDANNIPPDPAPSDPAP